MKRTLDAGTAELRVGAEANLDLVDFARSNAGNGNFGAQRLVQGGHHLDISHAEGKGSRRKNGEKQGQRAGR